MAETVTNNFYKGSQKVDHIDRQVNKYYYGSSNEGNDLSDSLRKKLDQILPFIKTSRHWFSVCKVLMELGEVGDDDFEGAVTLISCAYPEGIPMKPTAKDLASLNVQSLRFSIDKWNETDSPITRGLSAYKTIVLRLKRIMEDD